MTADVGGIAGERLKALIERIERLEEERKGIADDIKEIYAEAKGAGFEPKIMRKLVALRKKSKEDRQEEQTLLALYGDALGMQLGLDLLEPAPAPAPETQPPRAAAAKVEEPAGDRVSDRFDPVRRMAEGLASGDARVQEAAAKFPAGTRIEVVPSSMRAEGWPADLPTAFVIGADGASAAEPAQTGAECCIAAHTPPERVGAEELGRRARRDGKPIDACPYAMGDDGTRRSLWRNGWRSEDAAMRAGVAA